MIAKINFYMRNIQNRKSLIQQSPLKKSLKKISKELFTSVRGKLSIRDYLEASQLYCEYLIQAVLESSSVKVHEIKVQKALTLLT